MSRFGLCTVLSLFASETMAASREEPSVSFSASYLGEVWSVRDGGMATGERYLDQLDLAVEADLETLVGWRGATAFAQGLYNNGESLTEDLLGDFQVVSNIDGGGPARIYQLWLEQRLLNDRASVRAGLYDINSEFDTTETGGLFINGSHGMGVDFGQTGVNGPSIYPVTGLAVRGEFKLTETWALRAVVAEGVPGNPDRPGRTGFNLDEDEGALLVLETSYQDDRHKVALGGWRYTAEHEPFGEPMGAGNDGVYALAESRLTGEAGGPGVSAVVRVGRANSAFNPIEYYLGAGVSYTGPFAARPQDQLGVAIAWATLGAPFIEAEALAGSDLAPREVAVELTYRAVLNEYVSVQPDVQYVFNPGGRDDDDALVVGLRFEVTY